jgi:hypothetical protein
MTFRSTLIPVALIVLTGCLPYTVGSTAQTLAPDTTRRTAMVYFIPDAVDLTGDDSITAPMRGVDIEYRRGLSDRSDIGLRFPSGSGAVVTYKRRLAGTSAPESGAVSLMTGGGFVNFAEHGEIEVTMMASGKESNSVTPYGGLRAMQVIPLSRSAVHDQPTAGGFIGMRVLFGDLEVKPELGVYYDPSALGIRSTNYILVPAFGLTRR